MGGPLTLEELQETTKGRKHTNIKYFVETGTYKGDTTLMAAQHYSKVYTTEIVEELYKSSMKRAEEENVNNIQFMLGDSVELLKEIVPEVIEGAIFFIDAHISGHDSGWNQKQRVPLMEELNVILSHKLGPSVFIFDDLRFWKGKEKQVWDWEHISAQDVLKCFIDHGYDICTFYEKNDRFFVLTK